MTEIEFPTNLTGNGLRVPLDVILEIGILGTSLRHLHLESKIRFWGETTWSRQLSGFTQQRFIS